MAPKDERLALVKAFTDAAPVGSITIELDGAVVTAPLAARTFSSGSVGFHAQAKVVGADGRRYQLGVNATLIGSKPA